MKLLCNMLYIDLYHFMWNKRFILTIIGISVVCLFSGMDFIREGLLFQTTAINIFHMTLTTSMFILLFNLITSVPAVTSFCSDWNCQYIKPMISRSGTNCYIKARIISCFLTTFIATFLGLTLFLGILCIQFPLTEVPSDFSTSNIYDDPYLCQIILCSPILYALYRIVILSLVSSLWCMIGLLLSSIIPNRFVALTSPLIIGYLIRAITLYSPLMLNVYAITIGSDVTQTNNPILNLLYIFLFVLIGIFIFGITFGIIVKKRVGNEIT